MIAVPYDAFDAMAAFAAAISIAYASLPNFRHREHIRDHVRITVKKSHVADVVRGQPNLQSDECWCILFRLGALTEEGHPAPKRETDHNFQQRLEFKRFNWLYISNLDKLIAIALGSIATTVIWFGLLDRMYFPDPKAEDPHRAWFLGTVMGFYIVMLGMCALSVAIHRLLAAKSLDHQGWKYYSLNAANWATVVAFFFLLGLTVCGINILGQFGLWVLSFLVASPFKDSPEYAALLLTRDMLLLTIFLPAYLLWRGERLTEVMKDEIRRCVDELGKKAAGAAENADIAVDPNVPNFDIDIPI